MKTMPSGNFLPRVLDIVRSVRPLLLPHFGKAEVETYKTEHYNSPVTAHDKEVEAHLARELGLLDAAISFVGEERGGNRSARKFWLCDPIDGTVAFIEGRPHCTTMLALIEEGKPRFSIIYDFVNDVLYHAEQGHGAYENGKQICVSKRGPSEATIGIETQDAELFERLAKRYKLFRTMTAGHEFALVAKGEIEGRVCFKPYGQDYDFAPGTLLVSEAGGVVKNIGSDSYDYKNLDFITANRPVYEALTFGPNAPFPND